MAVVVILIMRRSLRIVLIFILVYYFSVCTVSSFFSFPFSFSASSLSRRSKSYLFSCLFTVFFSSVSLGLRPISVASKKSRIGLTVFGVLNSLFFSLSSLILGRFIISRARLLYSVLLCLAYFLYSNRKCSIFYFIALHYQHFYELDFLIQCR